MEKKQIAVLLPLPFNKAFDYLVPDNLEVNIGDFVQVPFGKSIKTGVVWSESFSDIPQDKVKPIINILENQPLTLENIKFVDWVSSYNMIDKGLVLKMMMSPPKIFDIPKKTIFPQPEENFDTIALSTEQETAVKNLENKLVNEFSATLIDGVTGSGKTEVYFEAIAKTLKEKKQVLVLLPEISLSVQWKERFKKRFGIMPCEWHSNLTNKMRRETWQGIISGEIKVVSGARSALFLPFNNLGLIVIDEEHDPSFKQEEGNIYNARDMAIVRASINKIPILLSSATPSIETIVNVQKEKYSQVTLPERFAGASMPEIQLIDLKKYPTKRDVWISEPLKQAICQNLEQQEQTLLFLNRRGYAPLTLCRSCGHRMQCPNCSAWLVEHRSQNRLVCHHCNYNIRYPEKCPECGELESFTACGPGIERIYEEIKSYFPEARINLAASDITDTQNGFSDIVAKLENHQTDIVIGTQILAKGHHFPMLTLVGIVDADIGLSGGDLRASERVFQLLNQVSGRAGRAEKKGRVLIQTWQSENPVMIALKNNDKTNFINNEVKDRQRLFMPPFGKLASLIISGKNEARITQFVRELAQVAPYNEEYTILGPTQAPFYMLGGRFRFRFLIKTKMDDMPQKIISKWLKRLKIPANVKIKIDIDPYSFL
ncbi:MAG: primosomal protein N' [Alphaproteobacteria bacterium]